LVVLSNIREGTMETSSMKSANKSPLLIGAIVLVLALAGGGFALKQKSDDKKATDHAAMMKKDDETAAMKAKETEAMAMKAKE
jgi:uncharacterized protein HemX